MSFRDIDDKGKKPIPIDDHHRSMFFGLECAFVLLSDLDTADNNAVRSIYLISLMEKKIKSRLQPLVRLLMSSLVCTKGAHSQNGHGREVAAVL